MGKRPNIYRYCFAGFTIVEMLLVVVLIALLAGATGGFYAGTYRGLLVKKAARQFLIGAKYARVLAVERQTTCTIEFAQENNGFYLVLKEPDVLTGEYTERTVTDDYFKPVTFSDGVLFEDIKINTESIDRFSDPETSASIAFYKNGTAQQAVVQIGNSEDHYTAVINAAAGRVRVFEGTTEQIRPDTIDLDIEY